MVHELQLRLLPRDAYNEQSICEYLRHERGLQPTSIRVLRRSIDARQRTVFVNLTLRVFENEMPHDDLYTPIRYGDVSEGEPVLVVGAGPGGLFAALRLIELGMKPIVLERGKDVRERKKDLARIRPEQRVNPESNYAFGEGGAGAYSDGKLFTRSKKRGNGEKILRIFVQHGASPNILSDAHPHIGTDRLPRVIENIRHTILQSGGEIHFETRMDSLVTRGNQVCGLRCTDLRSGTEREFEARKVILATGHSARDVYRPHSVPQPRGTRTVASGGRIQRGATGGWPWRLQFLHVPRRICGAGCQWTGANSGERHEPQQPKRTLEQQWHGGGSKTRRRNTGRRIRL